MSYDKMKYNELQAAAKEKGLPANGTKEELIARLNGASSTDAPVTPAQSDENDQVEEDGDTETAAETPATTAKPISEAQDRAEQVKADKALRTDAQKMKAHLDAQPKVSIMIPFDAGVNPEQAKKIPFHVNLNGYAIDIPKGVYVEVPKQVAEIIKERLESEGKIGSEWRIDRDANKQQALN